MSAEVPTPYQETQQRHADTRGFIYSGGDKEGAFLKANGFTPEGENQLAAADEALHEDDAELRSNKLDPLTQIALDAQAVKHNWDQERYDQALKAHLKPRASANNESSHEVKS